MTNILAKETLISEYRRETGGHYFDPETMRFFRSRVSETAFVNNKTGIAYFVTSEQFKPSYGAPFQRMYTVRFYDFITGNIGTAPGHEFQEYKSRTGAIRAAMKLADN